MSVIEMIRAWKDRMYRKEVSHSYSMLRRHNPLSPDAPYEPALVDQLIGAHLADTRPIDVISQISPRAVFLIHSADDQNSTTPLSGERQLFAAAREPKQEWIVPHGGHTGAVRAYHDEYAQRVLAFFNHYLK